MSPRTQRTVETILVSVLTLVFTVLLFLLLQTDPGARATSTGPIGSPIRLHDPAPAPAE